MRGFLRRHGWWVAAVMVALAYATPIMLQERIVNCARLCFASVETRTRPQLPDCTACAGGLAVTTRAPWTRNFSRRLREEFSARSSITAYIDAAVGKPSAVALHERFGALRGAWLLTDGGTGTLKLDLLGAAMPAAEPGRLAALVGDRRTLIERGLKWNQWYVATAALEAALLEGKVDRAVRLAEHYRGRPNSDLRLRVAAMLCAGMPENKRAIVEQAYEHAIEVMDARATKRNADFARDFGSARMVVEACASRLGKTPPPQPVAGHAGRLDHREQLLAYRWRLANAGGDSAKRQAARDAVEAFLGSRVPTPYRYDLAALFIDEIASLDDVLSLIQKRPGEHGAGRGAPERSALRVSVIDRPVVPLKRYQAAWQHMTTLMKEADAKQGQPLFLAQRHYASRVDAAAVPPADDDWVRAPFAPQLLAGFKQQSAAVAPVDRRKLRYELFHQRKRELGLLHEFLYDAGRLVAAPSEVETLLDALSARELRRYSLRSWAYARAVAAKRRGDQAAAKIWWARNRRLAALVAVPATAELYLLLGL